MPKEYLNPPNLFPSQQFGFSQIVTSTGGKTVYISGQVAWNAQQQVGEAGDLETQTRESLLNLERAMQAAGGTLEDVVSLRLYILGDWIHRARGVRETLLAFFPEDKLPTSTWIGVPALASPDFLIEIEAVAVIEQS